MIETDPIALGVPHRAPFLFIDTVLEVNAGDAAHCRKMFPPEEPFFEGHFPGDPLVPGVILAEALAQTAGIAGGGAGCSFRLAAVRGMKFLEAVRPGEIIDLHARKSGGAGGLWQFEVTARVAGRSVAEGILVLAEV